MSPKLHLILFAALSNSHAVTSLLMETEHKLHLTYAIS
jgi:hypothetical protein